MRYKLFVPILLLSNYSWAGGECSPTPKPVKSKIESLNRKVIEPQKDKMISNNLSNNRNGSDNKLQVGQVVNIRVIQEKRKELENLDYSKFRIQFILGVSHTYSTLSEVCCNYNIDRSYEFDGGILLTQDWNHFSFSYLMTMNKSFMFGFGVNL